MPRATNLLGTSQSSIASSLGMPQPGPWSVFTPVFFSAALFLCGLASLVSAATSVSQYGITWTFSQDKIVGQYANGDWWVVGPVTITSISPASTTDGTGWTKNGTVINPPPTTQNLGQGFDSSIHFGTWYNVGLNVSPAKTGSPLDVPVASSVVSAISVATPNTVIAQPQLEVLTTLTVVASAPPAGAFRPPPTGTDKTHYWNKSALNYGILQSLTPPASTLTLATVEGYFAIPWVAIAEGDSIQAMSPKQMPNYGRDAAQLVSHGLLSLHLNYTNAQKEKLYIRMVQYGIDVYGSLKAGLDFRGAGGLNNGRKAPMVLAGLALNDASIKAWSDRNQHNVFGEDKQTFYVSQSDVDRPRYTADGNVREPYTQAMIGTPEWGEQHEAQPQRDASNWGSASYRWVGGAQLGNALAIRLTAGGMADWNNPVFFDYEDRYWANEKTTQTFSAPNNISPFVYNMWTSYRGSGGAIIPPPPPVVTLAIGDRVKTLNDTNIRASAALAGTLLGIQIQGSFGMIIAGPVQMDNITWWQVNYDTGSDGWSGEDNLLKQTPPSAPQGVIMGP